MAPSLQTSVCGVTVRYGTRHELRLRASLAALRASKGKWNHQQWRKALKIHMATQDWGAGGHGGARKQSNVGTISSGNTGVAGAMRATGSENVGGSTPARADRRQVRITRKSPDDFKEHQRAEGAVHTTTQPRHATDNLFYDADAVGSSMSPVTLAARPPLADASCYATQFFRRKLYGLLLEWSQSFSASGSDADTLADANIISAGALRFFANVRGDFTPAVELWDAREGRLAACVLTWAARDVMSTDTTHADGSRMFDDGETLVIGSERMAGFVIDHRSHERKLQLRFFFVEHIRKHFNISFVSMREIEWQFSSVWGNMRAGAA